MAQITWRSVKRPNYFTGQLLTDEDFNAEQQHHLAQQRRHAQMLHGWGVLGLEVEQQGDRAVLVRPGSALDNLGREIIVDSPQVVALTDLTPNSVVYLTLEYGEAFEDADHSDEDGEHHTRVTELGTLQTLGTGLPPVDGSVLPLARLEIDAMLKIARVDLSIRTLAGSRVAPGAIDAERLADGAVTRAKLHASLRSGWLRLPFKPSSFVETEQGARNFVIGVTRTFCDSRGAKGTMAVPVPVGMTTLKTFVLAGSKNDGGIDLEVHRCGWDTSRNGREEGTVLKQSIPGVRAVPFHQSFAINWTIDAESHAVAVYVHAKGDCEISLVAAEFE